MGIRDRALPELGNHLTHEVLSELARGPLGSLEFARLSAGSEAGRLVLVRRVRLLRPSPQQVVSLRELGARAGRVSHPSIAKVLAVQERRGELSVISEYVEGVDLRTLLEQTGEQRAALPIEVSVRIVLDALTAVRALRARLAESRREPQIRSGLFPETIVVAAFGETLVTDICIAGALAQCVPIKNDPEIVRYLSPEELEGEVSGESAEVFTAGVLLWELLANKSLFRAEDAQKTTANVLWAPVPELHRLEGRGESIPRALSVLVARALERDPRVRFPSLAQMIGAFGMLPEEWIASETEVEQSIAAYCRPRVERLRALSGAPAASGSRELLTSAHPTDRPSADETTCDPSWEAPTYSVRSGQPSSGPPGASGAFRVPRAPSVARDWMPTIAEVVTSIVPASLRSEALPPVHTDVREIRRDTRTDTTLPAPSASAPPIHTLPSAATRSRGPRRVVAALLLGGIGAGAVAAGVWSSRLPHGEAAAPHPSQSVSAVGARASAAPASSGSATAAETAAPSRSSSVAPEAARAPAAAANAGTESDGGAATDSGGSRKSRQAPRPRPTPRRAPASAPLERYGI